MTISLGSVQLTLLRSVPGSPLPQPLAALSMKRLWSSFSASQVEPVTMCFKVRVCLYV